MLTQKITSLKRKVNLECALPNSCYNQGNFYYDQWAQNLMFSGRSNVPFKNALSLIFNRVLFSLVARLKLSNEAKCSQNKNWS